MCGITGMVLATHERTRAERQYLLDVFTYLLVQNQSRGIDATGVAWVNTEGKQRLRKDA